MAEAAGGSGGAGQIAAGAGRRAASDPPEREVSFLAFTGVEIGISPLSCFQWKGRNLRFLFRRRLSGVAGDVGPFGGAGIRRILEGVWCGFFLFHIPRVLTRILSPGFSATLLDASPITLDSLWRRGSCGFPEKIPCIRNARFFLCKKCWLWPRIG